MRRDGSRPILPGRTGVVLFFTLVLIGCDVLPRDNAGTLDRVRGGELRVGVVHNPPWVRISGDQVTGIEPELIERWAQQLHARVVWQAGAEADLVEALHRRDLDVLAGGLVSDSPYAGRAAFTQPYLEFENRYGSTREHVLAVMPGESALLLALDRFLASQDRAVLRREAEQQGGQARQP